MRRELGMFVALVLMCVGLYFSNPLFTAQSNVLNLTRQVSMLGIYAVGIGFVIITGGIDLSVGSVIGLTGVLIAKISSSSTECLGQPIWVGVSIALGVALLIGLVQGLLITRLQLQPFIVTLGFMLLLRGISQTIVEGGTLSFGNSPFRNLYRGTLMDLYDMKLESWNYKLLYPIKWICQSLHGIVIHFPSTKSTLEVLAAYPTVICIVVLLLATYALHFSVFGRYVYAIGGNRDAAAYSGINVKRVETLTYVISSGLAGVAGVCYAAYIGQMSHQVGASFELVAIAGAVLGGCSLRGGEGTVLGMLIGSALMRVIDNGINLYQWKYTENGLPKIWKIKSYYTFVIIGSVILLAVILDQVVHLVQARSRIRRAADAPPASTPPGGFEVVSVDKPPADTIKP